MNAAAAQSKLEELIRGRNPVTAAEVTIRHFPMTCSLVRERFEKGRNFQVNDEGVGVELPNGDWLWVGEQSKQGGPR